MHNENKNGQPRFTKNKDGPFAGGHLLFLLNNVDVNYLPKGMINDILNTL
jgi:hypothetical protein